MSQGDYVETEIKLYVEEVEPLRQKLDACGAVLLHPRTFERNIRYENAQRTLTGNGIVLRLRQDNTVRLTYKEPLPQVDDGIVQRFEAEVELVDLEMMDVILQKLGFHPYRVYEKYRTTYSYQETEIVLDELPYGQFVEIEGATDMIRQVLKELGWETFPHFDDNYLGLFERVKRHLNLQVNDLTFENFAGIDVPVSAFDSDELR